jgi:hypothetical protein
MAGNGQRRRKVWLGLGAAALVEALVFGAIALFGTPAHALVTTPGPGKICGGGLSGTSTTSPGVPGAPVICHVYYVGTMETGGSVHIHVVTPTNSITACQNGFSGTDALGNAYTVAGTMVSGMECKYVVTATISLNNPLNEVVGAPSQNGGAGTELGTESLLIPTTTASGTSVSQSQFSCQLETNQATCSPAGGPMGLGGSGSCVGGAANPFPVGGCSGGLPGPPATTTTTSHSTTTSAGGGDGGTTTETNGNNGGSEANVTITRTATVANGVKALSNTSAPEHPFPTVPLTIVVIASLLALSGGLGLARLRRQRRVDRK